MEDVIAVEVRLANGASRYFVTWGRIQHPVDPAPVCELVLRAASKFSLGGKAVSARVCYSLRDAADSEDAPYFYEVFLRFCQRPIPFGDGYAAWREQIASAMERREEIAYCGDPDQRDRAAGAQREGGISEGNG